MVEPLLSGIVLGLITVSALGLFVAAFLQYRRGNQFYNFLLFKFSTSIKRVFEVFKRVSLSLSLLIYELCSKIVISNRWCSSMVEQRICNP